MKSINKYRFHKFFSHAILVIMLQNDEDILTLPKLTSEASGVEDDLDRAAFALSQRRFTLEEKVLKGFLGFVPTEVEQYKNAQFNKPVIDKNVNKLTMNTGYKPYYLVFSPLNKAYNETFSRSKGLMTIGLWLRKHFGVKQYFATTEVIATKVHHNFIIWWDGDFKTEYEAYGPKHLEVKVVKNKWTMHIEPVGRLTGLIEYITKEKYFRVLFQSKDITSYNDIPQIIKEKRKILYK